MITLNSTIIAAKDQISSDLGGETAILNLESGVYYGLDEVGTLVWSLVQQPRTVSDVRDAILAEYEVEPARCEQDLLALLESLAAENLVEIKIESNS